MGLNSKEANNVALAEQVMELLPLYAGKEGVVAIGEIGYDDQTEAEDRFYRLQLELAKEVELPVLIHTPHRDKKKGTTRSMDVAVEHGMDPYWVVVDHNNEETVKEVLDRGFWAAFTIYPHTKMGSERMVEIVKQYGPKRIIVNSAADWGISDPIAVPKTAALMRKMGVPEEHVRLTTYQNALTVFGLSGQMHEDDWLKAAPIDQTKKLGGNSVLRGGQVPRVEGPDDRVEN
jgi:predicted metal-dependent TIM-barrel fold hydrolase